eukprot:GHVT01066437.1.p1 GENE.GHVT01066437.1~~GHVT01066437.1.p1  ORF type:complete len:1652 (+),score=348.01 GHVT01066437.1:485-5440(+)
MPRQLSMPGSFRRRSKETPSAVSPRRRRRGSLGSLSGSTSPRGRGLGAPHGGSRFRQKMACNFLPSSIRGLLHIRHSDGNAPAAAPPAHPTKRTEGSSTSSPVKQSPLPPTLPPLDALESQTVQHGRDRRNSRANGIAKQLLKIVTPPPSPRITAGQQQQQQYSSPSPSPSSCMAAAQVNVPPPLTPRSPRATGGATYSSPRASAAFNVPPLQLAGLSTACPPSPSARFAYAPPPAVSPAACLPTATTRQSRTSPVPEPAPPAPTPPSLLSTLWRSIWPADCPPAGSDGVQVGYQGHCSPRIPRPTACTTLAASLAQPPSTPPAAIPTLQSFAGPAVHAWSGATQSVVPVASAGIPTVQAAHWLPSHPASPRTAARGPPGQQHPSSPRGSTWAEPPRQYLANAHSPHLQDAFKNVYSPRTVVPRTPPPASDCHSPRRTEWAHTAATSSGMSPRLSSAFGSVRGNENGPRPFVHGSAVSPRVASASARDGWAAVSPRSSSGCVLGGTSVRGRPSSHRGVAALTAAASPVASAASRALHAVGETLRHPFSPRRAISPKSPRGPVAIKSPRAASPRGARAGSPRASPSVAACVSSAVAALRGAVGRSTSFSTPMGSPQHSSAVTRCRSEAGSPRAPLWDEHVHSAPATPRGFASHLREKLRAVALARDPSPRASPDLLKPLHLPAIATQFSKQDAEKQPRVKLEARPFSGGSPKSPCVQLAAAIWGSRGSPARTNPLGGPPPLQVAGGQAQQFLLAPLAGRHDAPVGGLARAAPPAPGVEPAKAQPVFSSPQPEEETAGPLPGTRAATTRGAAQPVGRHRAGLALPIETPQFGDDYFQSPQTWDSSAPNARGSFNSSAAPAELEGVNTGGSVRAAASGVSSLSGVPEAASFSGGGVPCMNGMGASDGPSAHSATRCSLGLSASSVCPPAAPLTWSEQLLAEIGDHMIRGIGNAGEMFLDAVAQLGETPAENPRRAARAESPAPPGSVLRQPSLPPYSWTGTASAANTPRAAYPWCAPPKQPPSWNSFSPPASFETNGPSDWSLPRQFDGGASGVPPAAAAARQERRGRAAAPGSRGRLRAASFNALLPRRPPVENSPRTVDATPRKAAAPTVSGPAAAGLSATGSSVGRRPQAPPLPPRVPWQGSSAPLASPRTQWMPFQAGHSMALSSHTPTRVAPSLLPTSAAASGPPATAGRCALQEQSNAYSSFDQLLEEALRCREWLTQRWASGYPVSWEEFPASVVDHLLTQAVKIPIPLGHDGGPPYVDFFACAGEPMPCLSLMAREDVDAVLAENHAKGNAFLEALEVLTQGLDLHDGCASGGAGVPTPGGDWPDVRPSTSQGLPAPPQTPAPSRVNLRQMEDPGVYPPGEQLLVAPQYAPGYSGWYYQTPSGMQWVEPTAAGNGGMVFMGREERDPVPGMLIDRGYNGPSQMSSHALGETAGAPCRLARLSETLVQEGRQTPRAASPLPHPSISPTSPFTANTGVPSPIVPPTLTPGSSKQPSYPQHRIPCKSAMVTSPNGYPQPLASQEYAMFYQQEQQQQQQYLLQAPSEISHHPHQQIVMLPETVNGTPRMTAASPRRACLPWASAPGGAWQGNGGGGVVSRQAASEMAPLGKSPRSQHRQLVWGKDTADQWFYKYEDQDDSTWVKADGPRW